MKNVNTTPPPRFCDMGEEELTAAIDALAYDVAVITEHMTVDAQEGGPRGAQWRKNAGIAKGFKSAHLKLARAEMQRRVEYQGSAAKANKAAAFAARAEAEQALIEARIRDRESAARDRESAARARESAADGWKIETAHAIALRQLAQAETSAAAERRNVRRARCFLVAARRLLPPDQMDAIWARAEELFPDMPRWKDAASFERKEAA